jgi:DNA polymerase-3 subunit gamma/tau
MVEAAQSHRLAVLVHDHARFVSLEQGHLRIQRTSSFGDSEARELAEVLHKATGQRWRTEACDDPGMPSLGEIVAAARQTRASSVRELPIVEAAFAAFPEARILPPETHRKAS